MKRSARSGHFALACLTILLPGLSHAAGLYKWTDKDGKVHYTETRPLQDSYSEVKAPAASPKDDAPPLPQGESIRGPQGECLTIKCMADEMESDRLKREGEYARRKAENEKAAKPPPVTLPKSAASGLSADQLQQLCLNGSIGPSTRDCNDVNKLRNWYEAEKARNDELKFRRETLDPGYKYR